MKKIFSCFLMAIVSLLATAQCTLEPFSVQKRVYLSDLVVEGRILSSESFWNAKNNFIYSAHTVEVSKLFQGNVQYVKNQKITIITEGGIVGLDALKVEPSLELDVHQVGIFFIKSSNLDISNCLNCNEVVFEGVASEQSFIRYDELSLVAHGYYETFEGIEHQLYPKIEGYTGKKFEEIGSIQIGRDGIQSLAAPVISNISLDTMAAGTGTVLTITGSNFGIARGNGKVDFIDPNFGDGRYFDPYYPSGYKSWSNTKIEVYVPSRAGTGKIRITNNSNESTVSSSNIYVKYAHSNVGYQGTTGIDSGFFQVNHINDNAKGGYTWVFNDKFAAKNNAVNAFLRAAETWRCETLMNWDVGNNTTTDVIARDDENLVRLTKFGDSRLGVCYSFYSGCFNSGKIYWYVTELDVDFDSTKNWYYGTGKPSVSQIDFETVATHELGHGHQLSHVIDKTKIMHYSLGPGDRNVDLSVYDLEGGIYVRQKSITGDPCSPAKYKAIKASECNLTKPEADIAASDTVGCPNVNITFSDATKGKVNNYAWNFGTDASIISATSAGPHVVSFSTSGPKDIRLVVTNDFGKDTFVKNIVISPDKPQAPAIFTHVDTVCVGITAYTVDSVDNATGYLWSMGSVGSFSGVANKQKVDVHWKTAGLGHKLSVVAKNSCGTSDETSALIDVLDIAVAGFSYLGDGLTYNFTNLSKNASWYMWEWGNNGDTTISINQSLTNHTFPDRGTYKVILTAFNVCSDSTIEQTINVNFKVGVAELNNQGISVLPNPANSAFRIEVEEIGMMFKLYDPMGRLVLDQKLNSMDTTIQITDLSNGMYTVAFTKTDGSTWFSKLLINK